MPQATKIHRFSVHARHLDAHHSRTIAERSFEAAAVAYVEDLHTVAGEDEISVIVRDIESGHEHCFRINLDSGDASPCGDPNESACQPLSRAPARSNAA